MIRSKPLRRAMAAAPTTPPAGPESTVRTGSRAAEARLVIPPLDCITKIRDCAAPDRLQSFAPGDRDSPDSAASRAADKRSPRPCWCARIRGTREEFDGRRKAAGRAFQGLATAFSFSGWRTRTAARSRSPPAVSARILRPEICKSCWRRRSQDLAVTGGAFVHSEAQILGTSGSTRSKKRS